MGPVAEALLHALEGVEEGDGVAHHGPADHPGHGPQEGLGGQRSPPSGRPGSGIIRSRKMRLSRKRVRRRGASRKSRAWRVGGVSTTIRSKRPSVVELVELLHRHVLLGARQGARDVAVQAVVEDGLGLLGREPA